MTIQVSVTLNGVLTNQASFADQASADAWVAACQAVSAFGQNAVDAVPATDMSEAIPAIPQAYVITQTDITAQLAAAQAVSDAHAYLKSTDWQAIRLADSGTPMDADVKAKRAQARLTINPPSAT